MTDNVTANAGSGGATFATDDDGTAHHPYVKLEFGADNTQTKVSSTDPLPVVQTGTLNIGTVSTVTTVSAVTAISNALPAGDNNIGNVDLASAIPAGTNNIGDVDVLSVPADPFGANADAASATGSISAKLRFIAGTGIPITGTVTVGSHAVTNAGTFATQVDGAALTALQLIDDVVFTDDAAFTPGTSKVAVIGAQADETATDSVDEGDAGALRMTLDRKLHAAVELESSAVRAAGIALTPKFAAISVSSSGANLVVTSVSAKKIRVLSYNIMASAAVNGKFTGNATDLTGLKYMAANGGLVAPFNPTGWFETGAGSYLGINLSAGNAVGGELVYIEVS